MLGWFIVLVPTVIIVMYIILAIVLGYNRKKYYRADKLNKVLISLYRWELKACNVTVISVICLIIIVFAAFRSHTESRSFIAKYESVTTEYKERTNTFNVTESIAIFNYAIDLTSEAAVYQYWNKYFDPFIPDKINDLKPIR